MSHIMTKPTKWLCAQQRLRSAWSSAQSDQSLRCAFNGLLRTQCFFLRTVKTLIRLGGYPGWSESWLGAHSFCWFCHVAAQLYVTHVIQTYKLHAPVYTKIFIVSSLPFPGSLFLLFLALNCRKTPYLVSAFLLPVQSYSVIPIAKMSNHLSFSLHFVWLTKRLFVWIILILNHLTNDLESAFLTFHYDGIFYHFKITDFQQNVKARKLMSSL